MKQYTPGRVKLAVAGYYSGLSYRKASTLYGVPRSTIADRITGKVIDGTKSGPSKYLLDSEEKELAKFLIGCAKIGFAKSRMEVLAIVRQTLAKKRGVPIEDVTITSGWWSSFKNRHPQLTLRTATPLSYARAIAQDPAVFEQYFNLLENTLSNNDLLCKPHCLFNCDESGFSMDHKPGKLVALKGMRQFNSMTSGNKSQITVLACCSANGYILPPMVIFDRKRLKPDLTRGEIPGTIYGLSNKGWIDRELFEEWFMQHFLTHIPPQRPVLLLLDGHSSHYHPSLIRKAVENGVILFCLPPHTTHLAQPLDRSCFSPLKSAWNQECFLYMSTHPGQVINRFNFMEIFSLAWIRGMTSSNVIAGFQATGVYPLNRKAICVLPAFESEDEDEGDNDSVETIAMRQGLCFIPLYSPEPCRSNHRLSFSSNELLKFQRRYENGYDLKHDIRYNTWLEIYHPTCISPSISTHSEDSLYPECVIQDNDNYNDSLGSDTTSPVSVLSEFLTIPKLPLEVTKKQPGCARVLTSEQNMAMLEEKEQQKQEKEQLKQEKKEQRQKRKEERQKIAEEKKKLQGEKKRLQQKKLAEGRGRQRQRHSLYHQGNEIIITNLLLNCT